MMTIPTTTAAAASVVGIVVILILAPIFLAIRSAGQTVISIVVMRAGAVGAILGSLHARREQRALPDGLDIRLQDDLDVVHRRRQIVGRVRVT